MIAWDQNRVCVLFLCLTKKLIILFQNDCLEAQIRKLEKAPKEVIDVDASVKNTMVVFSAIEELRKDTEEGWKKLAVPLDQVIEANNASNIGLKKRDVQLARWEDIMDGRVLANRVKVDELHAQVTFVILDALVKY